jgi:hypothetical protein
MTRFRVVASDPSSGFDLPQIRLASFKTLEEAERYRPSWPRKRALLALGYDRLELCPTFWADCAGGYRPFAVLLLGGKS